VSMTDDAAESNPANDKDDPSPTADELYAVFWGLQKSFAYPPRVFDSNALEEFKKGFEATLAKFKDMPKVMAESTRLDVKRKADFGEQEEFASSFNPKYLTSRELFELEVIFT
jgi:THO complex subunit 1